MITNARIEVRGEEMWLPTSWRRQAVRLLLVAAFLALYVGVKLGLIAATVALVLFAFVWATGETRGLAIGRLGFRRVPLLSWLPPLVPRSTVTWESVDRFAVRTGWRQPPRIVYWQKGRRQDWRSAIQPQYALNRGSASLKAGELCALLNELHASHERVFAPLTELTPSAGSTW